MKFFLSPLPLARIDAALPMSARQTLERIVAHNKARLLKGADSPQLRNRKDEMKKRLINRGKATFEQVTDEVGRERVLLSLYLEYGARTDSKWLPAFDHSISRSVLGENGSLWHAGRRRQATHLFFVHYNYLPPAGLAHLCTLLVQSYASIDPNGQELAAKWCRHRATLFSSSGHVDIIKESRSDESLPTFTQRVGVPEEGRFVECLRQEFLLNELKGCPLGAEIPALEIIESLRTKRADASLYMGAAALRIMVQRVAKEGKRKWTGVWPRWITRLGCDPRHGRSSAEGAKWWGWATDDELRLAQQGITGLTLKFFIQFLDGTVSAAQWKGRSDFLMALFDAGKIESARLALNYSTYQRLDRSSVVRDTGG